MRILVALLMSLLIAPAALAQDSAAAKEKAPKKQPNLIAAWEIAEVPGNVRDAYDLIQLVRPKYFQIRSRGNSAQDSRWGNGPGVVIDEIPRGGVEQLRGIPLAGIKEIRYLSGPDAANRYGAEYHAGAIVVVMK